MYPTSIGTQHMRTFNISSKINQIIGVPNYAAVIPSYVKAFPEYLRIYGYYTTNNMKTDYQFTAPVTVWDECDEAATYERCPKGKPFFSVYNFFITHESQLFKQSFLFKGNEDLLVDPNKVIVPPYYKDTPTVRAGIALLLSNIQLMDREVGKLIAQLKKDGLYDNSYIFFFSDHGGALPWMKREILERGTHIPFIVKFPKNKYADKKDYDLHSSVDLAPTVLSLAGVKIPSYMQGQAFLGDQSSNTQRKYVFAGRDRMDECYDRVRSVRDKEFRYICNFMPNQPKYQPLSYRLKIPMMREMLELHKEGKLNQYQDDWFKPTKPLEELYDVKNDPNELHNLADDPRYKDKLEELRIAFRAWMDKVGDMSYMPEKEMVKNWWHDKDKAPQTSDPVLRHTLNGYTLSCSTLGASIGYRILTRDKKDQKVPQVIKTWDLTKIFGGNKDGQIFMSEPDWNVYISGQVLKIKKGEKLIVNAMRIGYSPSIKTFNIE